MPLSDHKSFTVDFPNIFIKYNITITPQDVNNRYGDIDKSLYTNSVVEILCGKKNLMLHI